MLCNENVLHLLGHVHRYVLLANYATRTVRQRARHGSLLLHYTCMLIVPHLPQALLPPLILA